MSDDVKDWLGQCVACTCIKRKSPVGRHHLLGNIPTGHRWDRIAMDILDVCDPTPEGFRYILVIADYFSKWTEAFPMKNKCADTVADILVENIILRFGMPLVIHSDKPIIFVHVDDLKLCPGPQEISWTPNVSTAKSLCVSTVAFRPGSDIGEVTPDPSVDVSAWGDEIDLHQDSIVQKDLDRPID